MTLKRKCNHFKYAITWTWSQVYKIHIVVKSRFSLIQFSFKYLAKQNAQNFIYERVHYIKINQFPHLKY